MRVAGTPDRATPATPHFGVSGSAGGTVGGAPPKVTFGPPQAGRLVYREQCFGKDRSAPVENARRARYRRRSESSKWLIEDVVEDNRYLDPETGELVDSDWVRPPRPARCSWRLGEVVPVHAEGGKAHFSGTERCGSIWACPVCASVVRSTRASEITRAVERHHEEGGSILFVTLTIRHKVNDPLHQSLDAVLGSWRKLLQGSAWVGGKRQQGMRERYGVIGYIRSTEITHGANGWHPHIHALIFTDDALSDGEVSAFGGELHERWARFVEDATGRRPTREHGIDVQRVDSDGQVLGQYLAKMQDEGKSKTTRWGAAAELARTDVKRGRADNYVPFQLLDVEDIDLETAKGRKEYGRRRRLWAEYVEKTRGRRAITWSRGLKDLYDVVEKTDEEILEETDTAPMRWLAEGDGYDRVRRSDATLLAVVLEAAEREDWGTVSRILPGKPAPPGKARPPE